MKERPLVTYCPKCGAPEDVRKEKITAGMRFIIFCPKCGAER